MSLVVQLVTRGFVLDENGSRRIRRTLDRLDPVVGAVTLVLARERSGAFRAHLEASRPADGPLVEDGWAATPVSAVGQAVRAASRGVTKR